jgi:5-methylcytosine-specific restriction endonuclease McrA
MSSKTKSKNQEYLNKWLKSGKNIPKCINIGCDKPVAIRHWSAQGDPSLKTECCICSKARINGKKIDGIIFHKKNYCENKDGILGFKCPIDQTRYSEFPTDIYDMDHKDGDHHNNTIDNLITICKICHTIKGKNCDDFNSRKKSSRIYKNNIDEITNKIKEVIIL